MIHNSSVIDKKAKNSRKNKKKQQKNKRPREGWTFLISKKKMGVKAPQPPPHPKPDYKCPGFPPTPPWARPWAPLGAPLGAQFKITPVPGVKKYAPRSRSQKKLKNNLNT